MKKVKDNRKINKNFKNINLSEDNEHIIDEEYDLKEDEPYIEESTNKSDNNVDISNAGFPPLRLKNKNISNKERFFSSNLNTSIRDILLVSQKKNEIKNENDTELDIINTL